MPLKRTTFEVYMTPVDDPSGEPVEYVVPVILADQLRGELEGKKYGLGTETPLHLSALWAWAAMCREGHYAGGFHDFQKACIDYNKVGDDADADDVDPTRLAASSDSA